MGNRNQKPNEIEAPSEAMPAKPNATDPMQGPALDASPERFLSDVPSHIAALGDKAPPTPNAVPGRAPSAPGEGTKPYRLHSRGGWYDGHKHHGPGEVVHLTPDQADRLGTMVTPARAKPAEYSSQDSSGENETGTPGLTNEATGGLKR